MRDGGGHSQDRKARLAEALRENLRRRKAQQRSRTAAAGQRADGSRDTSGDPEERG